MGKVLNFPDKQKHEPDLPEEVLSFGDAEDDWFEAVHAMEQRFGGVSLSDLEDGDEEALKIADRALTKEWLLMHTDEINRK